MAPYLPYFDPNKNYIGAVILAVYDRERWYHDGKSEPWVRSALNGWDGEWTTGQDYEVYSLNLVLQILHRPSRRPEESGHKPGHTIGP